jgi:hypothetical protein
MRRIQREFSGPIGSSAAFKILGSAARNANRLTTRSTPHRHRREKPTHLRMVGSSTVASAVDGLSMMNVAVSRPGPTRRVSR